MSTPPSPMAPPLTTWTPSLGAWPDDDGVRFRVWAPESDRVEVTYENLGATVSRPLDALGDGTFGGWVPGIADGTRYWFRLDSNQLLPDPASRFQPDGVRGPSAVVNARRFAWTDDGWRGYSMSDLIVYELHVGTFSEGGTFAGVQSKLEYLRRLGVTAIELMPVAEFAGRRNWGYDGVFLFAPSHHYGHPDDLRRLVDAAHRLGLAVILDVVYNHVGPDGACWSSYTPRYFNERHHTPWGSAVNLDAEDAPHVRAFLIENALHWIHEFHVDGLRLDAAHALRDDSERHFLGELRATIDRHVTDRRILLIAEDERRERRVIDPQSNGGYGLDGLWSDDFHHELRRMVAGDSEGYFRRYRGTADALARTLAHGGYLDHDPADLSACVICLQNHDQVGNRAFGDRLHHRIDEAVYRAASTLLLCAPETPLIFMGQEWAASTPFTYFTDHEPELGSAITAGRREEFGAFTEFRDPQIRASIPDPQDERTFLRSRLRWAELDEESHRLVFRLYQTLIELRRTRPEFRLTTAGRARAWSLDNSTVLLWRGTDHRPDAILVVARLAGAGAVEVPLSAAQSSGDWTMVLSTEDAAFVAEPAPIRFEHAHTSLRLTFARPGALVLAVRAGHTPHPGPDASSKPSS